MSVLIVSVQRLVQVKIYPPHWFFLIFYIFCKFHMSSRKQRSPCNVQNQTTYLYQRKKKTHLFKHIALSASPIAIWSKYRNRKRIILTNISTYIKFIPFASVIKGKNCSYALDFIHGVQWHKHLNLGLCNVYFPKIENQLQDFLH